MSTQAKIFLSLVFVCSLVSGAAVFENIKISGNTISSLNTNGNISITPNGTGQVRVPFLNVDGQGSAPAAPSAGFYNIYVKDSDGLLYIRNSGGTEYVVGGGDASSLQGFAVDTATPAADEVLTWNDSNSEWEPRAAQAPLPSFTATRVLFGDGTDIPVTDAGLTYNSGTDALTAVTFVGALTGNASTATALAANPADCAANQFANTIAASGALSCAQPNFTDLAGVATIAQGGTNNGSLAVTNGGMLYTDGTKVENTGAGNVGWFMRSTGASLPVWEPPYSTGPINLLRKFNYGNAETGITAPWSESGGGTLSVTSTTADVGEGTYAYSYDCSANTDYFESPAITVPPLLQGKNCMLDLPYKGFDSNMTFQVHDGSIALTSTALTEAASGWSRHQIGFQCPTSGTIRFRGLCTGNAAVGQVDEVHLGNINSVPGVIEADLGTEAWVDAQANSTTSVKLTRKGQWLFVEGLSTVTGVFAGVNDITIPAAYTPDPAIYVSPANTKAWNVGVAEYSDTGTGTTSGTIQLYAANTLRMNPLASGSTYTTVTNLSATVPHTWANGDFIQWTAKWRVSGWQATAAISTHEMMLSTVKVRASTTVGTSVPNTGAFTIIPFATEDFDTHNAWSSDTFTAPKTGKYRINAKARFASATWSAANYVVMAIYKNGAVASYSPATTTQISTITGAFGDRITDTINLVKGDTISIYMGQTRTGGASTLDTTALMNTITIEEEPDFSIFTHHTPDKIISGNLNCDASGSITRNRDGAFATVGNASSGACAVTFASGTFSGTPECTASVTTCVGGCVVGFGSMTSSGFTLQCITDTGGAGTSCDANVNCKGPR